MACTRNDTLNQGPARDGARGRARRWRRALASLALAASLTLLPDAAAHAETPTPLRNYSDDAALAEHLLSDAWPTPADGAFDVLALSGGGPNGAFGAGVLAGWSARGDRPVFDHVTGVSTGALIAPFAYLGSAWDGALRAAYLDPRAATVMRRRLFAGLVGESVFSGTPLRTLVDSYVTQALVDAVARESLTGRSLIVVTTDLEAQRSVGWDMGAIARLGGPRARALFRDVMLASASIPGIFPPVRIAFDGRYETHVDGGVAAPIYAIPEALADRRGTSPAASVPLRLFMIANVSLAPAPTAADRGTLAILRRSLATSGKASMRATLQLNAALAARYGAEFRMVSIPAGQSVALDDFSPDGMAKLFALGTAFGAEGRWRERVLQERAGG